MLSSTRPWSGAALILLMSLLASLGVVSALPAPAVAAPAPAFDCTDPRFFAQAENASGVVQLYEGRYTETGDSQWTTLGPGHTGTARYNALGFNPIDEHLYGVVSVTSGAAGNLVRINRDGSVTQLGASDPALGSSYSTLWDSGEFDPLGNYYVGSGNAGSTGPANIRRISNIHTITGTTGTRPAMEVITLTPTPRYADLAWKDGYLWSHNYGQTNTFYRININGINGQPAGTVDSFSSAGILPPASASTTNFGSAFTMTNGNLAFISTQGRMFQVSVTNPTSASPTFELVSDVAAPVNSRSDAANCSTALPASLSLEKTGPETVVLGETITWELTVTNDGPGISSGFVLTDALPTGLSNVTASSPDSGCIVNGAQTTVTCNGGRLEVDDTAVVTITATAPNRLGPVINTASVIGNEDPNPADPVTAESEVTLGTRAEQPTTLEVEESVLTFDETGTSGGTVTFDPETGVFTYTPPADFSGTDTFTYETPTGTVTVVVTVRPVATNDAYVTPINTPITLSPRQLQVNDIGINLEITSVSAPVNGSVALVDGNAVFTPTAGFYGTASFTYTLAGDGGSDTATVTILVNPDAPVAVDDEFTMTSGGTLNLTPADVLVNDSGTEIEVVAAGNPSTGTVGSTGGNLVFTPDPDFSGVATFQYLIRGPGGSDSATVTVTVAPVAPGATDDSFAMDAGGELTLTPGDLLTNDTGTAIAVTSLGNPSTGTVELVDGSVVFTPDPDFSGDATFEYTIEGPGGSDTATVTVTVEALAPAAADDAFSTDAGVPVVLEDILANDTGTAISRTDFTQPAHGTVTGNDDGELVYAPDAGFSGTDTLEYTIEGPGGSDTATITITVAPVAVDDAASTSANTPVVLDEMLGNDLGVDLVVESFTQPANGTVTVNGDGHLVYTPDAGFSGTDSFEYTAAGDGGESTATVTITVVPVATDDEARTDIDEPIVLSGLLGNDVGSGLVIDSFTQPEHGTVAVNGDGHLVYTPNAGYYGDDAFEYTVVGAGGQSTATVTIVVDPLTPVAHDDEYSTAAGEPVLLEDLLANDLGTDLVIVSMTGPANGTIVTLPSSERVYQPTLGFSGTDSFEYMISGPGGFDTATVTITVTPTAGDADHTTSAGDPVVLDDLADSFVGRNVVLDRYTEPEHGTVTVDGNGNLVYTPEHGFSGADSFEYTVVGDGGESTATVTITVVPVAVADSVTTPANTPVGIVPTDNDRGTGLEFVWWDSIEFGTVTEDESGHLTFTPPAGYSGVQTFEYGIRDSHGSEVTGTVTLRVLPVAAADHRTITAGQTVDIALLINDLGSGLTVQSVTQPSGGTVSVDADGVATYVPRPGFLGTDSFEYTIVDADGQTVTGTVTIEVLAAEEGDGGGDTGGADEGSSPDADDSAADDGLSATGPALAAPLLILAAMLMVLGLGAVLMRDRRREARL